MNRESEAFEMIARLENAGHEAYIVGGSLRDRLLGREAYDIDMTTSALPEETVSIFSDMRVIPTGIKHGTVTVLAPSGAPVEITTFRTDGSYSDSRHPDSVTFTRSLPDDLARRDFTVNAMAFSPRRGVIDLFGGREDLEVGLIRCVGQPEKRFSEDALRILRAFRFSAQLGFSIEGETYRAAIKLGHKITDLARERVASELMKLLSAPAVAAVLEDMLPIMAYVLPEAAMEKKRIALCDRLSSDPILRLAMLIYDGDPEGVARSLKLSTADKNRLCRLSAPRKELRSEADARRLMAELSSKDDCIQSVIVSRLAEDKDPSDEIRLIESAANGSPCLTIADLAVDGESLMSAGVQKGRQMGAVLHRLLDAVIEDPSLNNKETLLEMAREWGNG